MWLVRRGDSMYAWDVERDGDAGIDEVYFELTPSEVASRLVGERLWRRPLDTPMHFNQPSGPRYAETTITREQYHRARLSR